MATLHDLLRDPPVLFEGAMGTMLMGRGLPPGRPGELFTIERPDVVAGIHRAYRAAGAQVLKTNTFNANEIRLRGDAAFPPDAAETCNRLGVALAREAAGTGALVAGSIGPLGVMLEPHGEISPHRAIEVFTRQATALVAAGADLLLVETMYDLREALAALNACRAVSHQTPVIVTLTVSRTPRGFFTMMGDAPAESLRRLRAAGAAVVGLNCTLAGEDMIAAASEIVGAVDAPILVQPNAGQPQVADGATVWPESPAAFAAHARRLADLGVSMIGGCCGTTPAHIAAISAR